MILGLCTGPPSLPTPAGIQSPEFFGEASGFPSVSGLESASSGDLDGAGDTGGTTGMAVGHFSTITPGSLIAGTLATRDSITVISAMGTAISATVTSVAAASTTAAHSTVLPGFTPSQGCAPEHSVALIMAEMPEAFRLAGGRALAEEGFMAEVVAVSFPCPPPTLLMEKKNDKELRSLTR